MARQKQISVGLVFVTSDPAAQLVQIAQSETIRAVDNDGIRVWNIQAALDNGGGEQNVGFAIDELGHDFFQFVAVHLAMADHDAGHWAPARPVFAPSFQ